MRAKMSQLLKKIICQRKDKNRLAVKVLKSGVGRGDDARCCENRRGTGTQVRPLHRDRTFLSFLSVTLSLL